MKKFDVGIYCSRFLPSCDEYIDYIDTVAKECRLAYIILLYDNGQEDRIYPTIKRIKQLQKITYHYQNVIPAIVNISGDWKDMMLKLCENPEVVYGNELYYEVYPNIRHIDFDFS